MRTFLNFFLFPEKSNLQLALWLGRFLLLIALLHFLRASVALLTVLTMPFGDGGQLFALAGGKLVNAGLKTFGLSLLGLIVSHLLVFSICCLRDGKNPLKSQP